jgi:hypothetical protein
VQGRLQIWRELLHPLWRWLVLIPFAILGVLDTIRDDILRSNEPADRLGYWIPAWSWRAYALIIALLTIILILEGAYRAIKRREEILFEIAATEKTLARLSDLHKEGKRRYFDKSLPVDVYVRNLELWEAEVAKLIQEKYSSSELHFFRSFGGGAQYMIDAPDEWLSATEPKRILYTARIDALDQVIQSGGNQFLGPKIHLDEWIEARG